MTKNLFPCPFCGSSATMEQMDNNRWSVGCDSPDELMCMGNQSFATFSRQVEARDAWNKRTSTEPQEAWQPIETFPENGEEYLACNDQVAGGFYQVVFWDDGRLSVPDVDISYTKGFFTHWKRLDLTPADVKAVSALSRPEQRSGS